MEWLVSGAAGCFLPDNLKLGLRDLFAEKVRILVDLFERRKRLVWHFVAPVGSGMAGIAYAFPVCPTPTP